MKEFILHIVKLIILSILIITLIDLVKTNYIINFDLRKKTNNFKQISDKNFDIVVFGNSRVNFNIDTRCAQDSFNLKVYNFGIPGSNLPDIYQAINYFYEFGGKSKLILIQLDNDFPEKNGNIISSQELVINARGNFDNRYLKSIDSYPEVYLPHYIYSFNRDLSWREDLKRLFYNGRKNEYLGFRPLYDTIAKPIEMHFSSLKDSNPWINEIESLIEEKNSRLAFFTSPVFYSNMEEARSYYKRLSELCHPYINQSELLEDCTNCFKDGNHVSYIGARKQTVDLISQLKKRGLLVH